MKRLLILLSVISFAACTSNTALKLKATSYTMHTCLHPSNGFVKTGPIPSMGDSSRYADDSFIFDIENEKFVWKDYNGRSKNKMWKLSESGNQTVYATEHNAIRITKVSSKNYIVEIIFYSNGSFCMLTYQCYPHQGILAGLF